MTRNELRHLMASLRGYVDTEEQQRAANKVESQFVGYMGVLDALDGHSRPFLRAEASLLRQRGGEAWAIGEMVERACILLDALEITREEGR